jgi:cytochrome b subunit of formate dehydrogenase
MVRWKDFSDVFETTTYNLGIRQQKPSYKHYNYIEKAEYWALVWGSIVMALTGGLMTWASWTLRVFPKWLFDVVTAIHYYEAILACLAILVWHAYFVMFDPDEYPMKWTWITGMPSAADRRHRRPEDEQTPPNSEG